eukprot:6203792-Amphidinium_carterae.1
MGQLLLPTGLRATGWLRIISVCGTPKTLPTYNKLNSDNCQFCPTKLHISRAQQRDHEPD